MASLNGIAVKELKSIDGPEGIVWAGELYLNDVMIGGWFNDYYGGRIILNCFRVMMRES